MPGNGMANGIWYFQITKKLGTSLGDQKKNKKKKIKEKEEEEKYK